MVRGVAGRVAGVARAGVAGIGREREVNEPLLGEALGEERLAHALRGDVDHVRARVLAERARGQERRPRALERVLPVRELVHGDHGAYVRGRRDEPERGPVPARGACAAEQVERSAVERDQVLEACACVLA